MKRANDEMASRSGGDQRGRAVAALAGTLLLAALVSPAFAEKPAGAKKLNREIGIMERTIDEVLIESPNLLVSGGAMTDGIYVGDYGVVFTVDASPIPQGWRSSGWFSNHVEFEDEGDRIIVYKDKHGWDEDDGDEGKDAKKDAKARGKREKERFDWFAKRTDHEKKMYERGKEELRDVLVDYGDMLSSLRDDQSIVLAVQLHGAEYLDDQKISQCVMTARVGDLRALTAGTITRDAMLTKVTIDER